MWNPRERVPKEKEAQIENEHDHHLQNEVDPDHREEIDPPDGADPPDDQDLPNEIAHLAATDLLDGPDHPDVTAHPEEADPQLEETAPLVVLDPPPGAIGLPGENGPPCGGIALQNDPAHRGDHDTNVRQKNDKEARINTASAGPHLRRRFVCFHSVVFTRLFHSFVFTLFFSSLVCFHRSAAQFFLGGKGILCVGF